MTARVNVPFYGSATRKRAMEFPEERPDPPVIWSIDRKSRCKGAALEFGKNNSAIKSRSREYTAAEAFRPALGTYRAKTRRARVEAFDRGSTPTLNREPLSDVIEASPLVLEVGKGLDCHI